MKVVYKSAGKIAIYRKRRPFTIGYISLHNFTQLLLFITINFFNLASHSTNRVEIMNNVNDKNLPLYHHEFSRQYRAYKVKQKQGRIMALYGKSFAFRLAANCALPAISEKNWSL